MLENLSEKIRGCYLSAEDCKRLAREQNDPALRQVFLDTARRWMIRAHSYELTELPELHVQAEARGRLSWQPHVRLQLFKKKGPDAN